jgi:hypothetical protein
VKILLILIQFEYVTDKLVTESEDILEILVYLLFYFILFYFMTFVAIWQVNTVLEIATRWKAAVNTE